MAFRHAIIDSDPVPSCGVIVASALVGRPTSVVERILLRDGYPVHSLDARDLATAIAPFGLGLWFTEGYDQVAIPLDLWLDGRDRRVYALVVEDQRGGPRHFLAACGLAVCDGGVWSRDGDLGRWSVRAAYAVEPG
jgi:hypothetical protein